MKTLCGIDFGTSNSTIGVARGDDIALVPVEDAATTIPSAIFYPSEGDAPLYGRAAIRAYTLREHGRLMRSLKSILGSDLINERTPVGGRSNTFEGILVGFVKHLKAKAEAFAGGPIEHAVMGRPVHFVDGNEAVDARAQSKLGDIARAAGFKSVAFQFEPIAAALSFEHTAAQRELAFIADIGGGTADFSVVEVGPDRRRNSDRADDILANDGIRVGGTNLDMRLSMAAVMPHLGSRSKTVLGHDLPRWPFVDMATWHSIHTIGTPRNRLLLKQILDDCAPPVLFARYMQVVKRQTGHLIAGHVEPTVPVGDDSAAGNCAIAPLDVGGEIIRHGQRIGVTERSHDLPRKRHAFGGRKTRGTVGGDALIGDGHGIAAAAGIAIGAVDRDGERKSAGVGVDVIGDHIEPTAVIGLDRAAAGRAVAPVDRRVEIGRGGGGVGISKVSDEHIAQRHPFGRARRRDIDCHLPAQEHALFQRL